MVVVVVFITLIMAFLSMSVRTAHAETEVLYTRTDAVGRIHLDLSIEQIYMEAVLLFASHGTYHVSVPSSAAVRYVPTTCGSNMVVYGWKWRLEKVCKEPVPVAWVSNPPYHTQDLARYAVGTSVVFAPDTPLTLPYRSATLTHDRIIMDEEPFGTPGRIACMRSTWAYCRTTGTAYGIEVMVDLLAVDPIVTVPPSIYSSVNKHFMITIDGITFDFHNIQVGSAESVRIPPVLLEHVDVLTDLRTHRVSLRPRKHPVDMVHPWTVVALILVVSVWALMDIDVDGEVAVMFVHTTEAIVFLISVYILAINRVEYTSGLVLLVVISRMVTGSAARSVRRATVDVIALMAVAVEVMAVPIIAVGVYMAIAYITSMFGTHLLLIMWFGSYRMHWHRGVQTTSVETPTPKWIVALYFAAYITFVVFMYQGVDASAVLGEHVRFPNLVRPYTGVWITVAASVGCMRALLVL